VQRAPIAGEDGYTWDDYRSWTDDERWEIIGGVAYAMVSAPTTWHQWIQHRLSHHFTECLRGRQCVHYTAATDVKLSDEDVVQPDLLIVCDRSQIRQTHIEGAPTLVVEILSPSTMKHDKSRKMELYARCGVREYWTVQVYPAFVEAFVLEGSGYRLAAACDATDTLQSPTLDVLRVDLKEVYDFPNDSPGIQLVKEAAGHLGKS
jgi:Uma2 family endonuclease